MRVPGSSNHKSDPPKPVHVLELEPDRRYTPDDIDEYTLDVPEPTRPSKVRGVSDDGTTPYARKTLDNVVGEVAVRSAAFARRHSLPPPWK